MENTKEKRFLKILTVFEFVIFVLTFFDNFWLYDSSRSVFGNIAFYISAYSNLALYLVYPVFVLVVIVEVCLIFKNLFSKTLVKSSIVALLMTVSQPALILTVYSKITYYVWVFSSSPKELFYSPDGATVIGLNNSINFSFVIIQVVLFIIFLIVLKKENSVVITGKRKVFPWIASIILIIVLTGGYVFAESLVQSKRDDANVQYRLNSAGIDETKPINGFEISNLIYNADNFGVKIEFSKIPSRIAEGTHLVVFAKLPTYVSASDYTTAQCTVQRDSQTNVFYCTADFSDYNENYADKSIYSFYLDTSNQ